MTTLDALRPRLSDMLRAYYAPGASPETRTEHLRKVADGFVDARALFTTAAGDPDWKGATHAYRHFVGGVLADANVPTDERSTVLAAIRYHVSLALRERVDADTLQELGLRSETARDRSIQRRVAERQVLDIAAGGPPLTTLEEVATAVRLAKSVLQRIERSVLDAAPAGQREALNADLTSVAKRALSLT